MDSRKREQHGMSRTPTYHAWAMMKQRCYNDKQARSERYMGRGIQVCERWRNSFAAFLEDMGEAPDGMSIDRIDNDGDYCPENCRWATPKGITANGETLTLSEWARRVGLSRQALLQRMQTGWTIEEAVTTPKGSPRPSRQEDQGQQGVAHKDAQPKQRKAYNRTKRRRYQLGARITELRQQRNWSQRELAERINGSLAQVSMMETGKTIPTLKMALVLARVFDIAVETLAALVP